ncbi:hypothetical protein B0T26DRAFT_409317 [Lasiosphaeria miniovina]|uniref:Peptidase S8/S53 domain-containing protein n=1 Tax=Lasiosphaeria miniovina TaxID=1954250 RepID=A0AA40DRP7_9PEZI|nr:uncharacterized protein B0T26DRAFT_409317 [Lasiosphaeria miniovina]KAK0709518.1 hypothetical protein B0T26DRAFT_409317 [Lasiosphaeria miniovina]
MSFGFEDENDVIDAAVDNTVNAGKLIIAAASNNGSLSGRARPARKDGVICIHATDGKGNKGGMNPSPQSKTDNFATIGVAVPCKWKGKDMWKSGTSFAVPIAAGFAAGSRGIDAISRLGSSRFCDKNRARRSFFGRWQR